MNDRFFGYEKLFNRSPTVDPRFKKVDAPLLESTTAAHNIIYGATIWTWANRQCNAFAALKKVPWVGGGVRVATGDPATWATGLGEEGDVQLTDSVMPTYAYMKYGLKQIITKLQYSRKQLVLSKAGDDSIPTPEQLRRDCGEGHALGLNKMIMYNCETAAAALTADNTGTAGLEFLDRIISADAEEDDLGGTYNHAYDPFVDGGGTYDRDSGTTHDSVVVHGDGTLCYQTGNPLFTTDATLTLDAIDTLYSNCRKNGLRTENAFWLTGWDTYMRWKNLIDPKQRFVDPVNVQFSVNGAQTEVGAKGGFTTSSYYNIPIIIDQNCPTDTISKIFLIDQSSVFLRIATPTILVDSEFPLIATRTTQKKLLEYESFYLTEGELACTRFNTSGKLSALK